MEKLVVALSAIAIAFGVYAVGHAIDENDKAPAVAASASGESAALAASTDAAATGNPTTVTGSAGDVAAGSGAVVDESQPHAHDASGASIAGSDAAAHDMTDAEHAAMDDRGFSALANGEQHGHEFTQPLTAEERQELGRQLTLARDFALKYPTVKDAVAAGWLAPGPFSPGLGSHHINPNPAAGLNGDGVMDDSDISQPLALMYDGVEEDSHVAGLFYGTFAENAEGFAGPNDVWHKHKNICTVYRAGGGIDTPLGADRDSVTKEQCDAVGGSLLTTTPYLLHVWVVPGYESPEGVFAHLSSGITCRDGTYNTIGLESQIGKVADICTDANS